MPDELGVEWLTAVVLGAASTLPLEVKTKSQGVIVSPKGNIYQVYERIGGTEIYTLYSALIENRDSDQLSRYGILKIAIALENNQDLEKEATILKRMRTLSLDLDSKVGEDEIPYNYHYFFPELVETFICDAQKGRRINILGFPAIINKVSQLEPISALEGKEHVYVDPKTGAWMLGKTLKTAGFAHEYGIANRFWTGSNILFEMDLHGITIFDWTKSLVYPGNVPKEVTREEITQLGRSIVRVLGGDPETGKIPISDQLPDNRFEQFLGKLVKGGFSDADEAHDSFYRLIWSFWPHEFHPFTTYPL